ncbi:MAG: hypothetical protein JSS07_11375 [Proteobacteria bacterium]|nr:hypothetical protein [Pseudomonadota bacterium]
MRKGPISPQQKKQLQEKRDMESLLTLADKINDKKIKEQIQGIISTHNAGNYVETDLFTELEKNINTLENPITAKDKDKFNELIKKRMEINDRRIEDQELAIKLSAGCIVDTTPVTVWGKKLVGHGRATHYATTTLGSTSAFEYALNRLQSNKPVARRQAVNINYTDEYGREVKGHAKFDNKPCDSTQGSDYPKFPIGLKYNKNYKITEVFAPVDTPVCRLNTLLMYQQHFRNNQPPPLMVYHNGTYSKYEKNAMIQDLKHLSNLVGKNEPNEHLKQIQRALVKELLPLEKSNTQQSNSFNIIHDAANDKEVKEVLNSLASSFGLFASGSLEEMKKSLNEYKKILENEQTTRHASKGKSSSRTIMYGLGLETHTDKQIKRSLGEIEKAITMLTQQVVELNELQDVLNNIAKVEIKPEKLKSLTDTTTYSSAQASFNKQLKHVEQLNGSNVSSAARTNKKP